MSLHLLFVRGIILFVIWNLFEIPLHLYYNNISLLLALIPKSNLIKKIWENQLEMVDFVKGPEKEHYDNFIIIIASLIFFGLLGKLSWILLINTFKIIYLISFFNSSRFLCVPANVASWAKRKQRKEKEQTAWGDLIKGQKDMMPFTELKFLRF